jgi:hypothetical protein
MARVLIGIGMTLLLIFLLAIGPASGYLVKRKRHDFNREAEKSRWDFGTGEFILPLTSDVGEPPEKEVEVLVDPDLLEGHVTSAFPNLGDQYFAEDPLGSASLPSELDPTLPILAALLEEIELTGKGALIESEFQAWNLYQGASA